MALKDKLMTLEDFKAVRDVDVASNSAQFTEIKADLDDKVGTSKTIILPSNYAKLLPTLDNTELAGTEYTFVSTKAMTAKNGGLWGNVPKEMERGQCTGIISTIGSGASNVSGTSQILTLINHGKTYTRYYNHSGQTFYWTEWKAHNQQDVIVALDGSGDFTSFTEAMVFATQFKNCHVTVKAGTYDIISEYQTKYGSSFFTNFDGNTENVGIVLKNGVVVEFAATAKLVCNYTGSNTTAQRRFSPLNAGSGGFTLINVTAESKNVRYTMHDERKSEADVYHNKYIGCRFKHDKGTGNGYIQVIGGGLGVNGNIEIDGCIFESVGDTGNIVSWHNCVESGAKSSICVKNSVINGRVRFSYYGTSTEVSTMIVTGCKMLGDPVVSREVEGYETVNVEVIAWGNTIVN